MERNKVEEFQRERIEAFDKMEPRFKEIIKAIKLAKIETIKHYRNNPSSWEVVTPTDMINDYLEDIETLLNINKSE